MEAIVAIAGPLSLVFIALFTMITSIVTVVYTFKTNTIVKKTELNTNSMKDALVKATAEASLAQGRVEGIASNKAETKAESI